MVLAVQEAIDDDVEPVVIVMVTKKKVFCCCCSHVLWGCSVFVARRILSPVVPTSDDYYYWVRTMMFLRLHTSVDLPW